MNSSSSDFYLGSDPLSDAESLHTQPHTAPGSSWTGGSAALYDPRISHNPNAAPQTIAGASHGTHALEKNDAYMHLLTEIAAFQ